MVKIPISSLGEKERNILEGLKKRKKAIPSGIKSAWEKRAVPKAVPIFRSKRQ
jgi:hypothetical protein